MIISQENSYTDNLIRVRMVSLSIANGYIDDDGEFYQVFLITIAFIRYDAK